MPNVSIVIRTRNEEKWLNSCLQAVFNQSYKDFELIVVDDHSTDATLSIAKQFDIKIISYDGQFFPGAALNTGIRESVGDFIVCLSGHCIPTTEEWLANLRNGFADQSVAGVYGRQEPLPYSSDTDKRDLWTIFGMDRKVQRRDSFFHNANSMLRRDVWEKIPFDEKLTNIEDRFWAKKVLENGYTVIYEPEASVYHWHGIHQNGDELRCKNVVRLIETHDLNRSDSSAVTPAAGLNIAAIIPVKGLTLTMRGKSLLYYSIQRALESELVNNVFVTTDNADTAETARSLGAQVPFLRPSEFSMEYVGIGSVLIYTLRRIMDKGILPDIVLTLQVTSPFRPKGFIDQMIREMLYTGVDCLIPAFPQYHLHYKREENGFVSVDQGFMPKKIKEPVYESILGMGLLTKASLIEDEKIISDNVGIFPVKDKRSTFEINDSNDTRYFDAILGDFWEESG